EVARAAHGDALAHQRGRRGALLRRDEVQRAALVGASPAPPVAGRLERALHPVPIDDLAHLPSSTRSKARIVSDRYARGARSGDTRMATSPAAQDPSPHFGWHGIDFADPDGTRRDDPFESLHRLRAAAPVNETPLGFWRLSRYADCVRL